MFLIGGLALFLVSELESKVAVYDISKGKKPHKKEEFYHMTDPSLYFSKVGDISLNEFKRGIKEIENDSELMQIIKRRVWFTAFRYGKNREYFKKTNC